MDVAIVAVLMIILQMTTILCPTLTSRRSLPACPGVISHPSDKEVAPLVARETVLCTWHLHFINDTACHADAMTVRLILLLMIQPAKQQSRPRSQYYYWTQIMPTTTASHNSYHSRPLWKRWYNYYLHLNWSNLASYKHINFSMTHTPIEKLTISTPHLPIMKLITITTWHCRKALTHLRLSPYSTTQSTALINQATKIFNEGNQMEAIWVLCSLMKVMGIPTTSRYHCRKTSHGDHRRRLLGAQLGKPTAAEVYGMTYGGIEKW